MPCSKNGFINQDSDVFIAITFSTGVSLVISQPPDKMNLHISLLTTLGQGIIKSIKRLLADSADKIADFAEYNKLIIKYLRNLQDPDGYRDCEYLREIKSFLIQDSYISNLINFNI